MRRWLRRRSTLAGHWLRCPVVVSRGGVVAVAVALGLLLGGLVYLAGKEARHAREQRQALQHRDEQLAGAIARIEAIEQPTAAELRRRLALAIASLTPEQARKILRRAVRDLSPAERRRLLRFLRGGEAPRGGNPPPGLPGPSPSPPGDGPQQGPPGLPEPLPPTPLPDLPELPLPDLPGIPCLPQLCGPV